MIALLSFFRKSFRISCSTSAEAHASPLFLIVCGCYNKGSRRATALKIISHNDREGQL